MQLRKPSALKKGDKVATVSLSWGGAGDEDLLWRYQMGKKRLEEQFGLQVVEMPHTLCGSKFIYEYPEKRAEDLMNAFADPSIKGIFACIGGYESVRMLPYIDYGAIRNNPKIFIGYSDTTVSHMICRKAGVASFYGPSILAEFAENVEIFDYTSHWVDKVLFNTEAIGEVPPSPIWTSEFIPWEEKNKGRKRKTEENNGYEVLQGEGVHRGELIGGCIEVLEMLKGTEVWPPHNEWEGKLLFFETSEDKPTPEYLGYWLRNYGSQGILQRVNGLLFGKPYDNQYYDEYKEMIVRVVRDELKLTNLPIFYNMSFGHTSPMMIMPYGVMAELDCEGKTFRILESGVV
ncbi:S66 family peptidase [Peribacillus acanthi]|uniref:S66 family peptidase n=1 Tax=Peribacillus acanthi TaxID=2171554 RepID=UPI000D3E10C2|nr:S66 peptidase family protein [Peribacillus acanthi]